MFSSILLVDIICLMAKIFKRNYPSIYMAVSDKSRNHAMKQYPQTLASAKPDELAEFYAEQLRGFSEKIATGLVRNGLCGQDETIAGMVLDKLQEARAL